MVLVWPRRTLGVAGFSPFSTGTTRPCPRRTFETSDLAAAGAEERGADVDCLSADSAADSWAFAFTSRAANAFVSSAFVAFGV